MALQTFPWHDVLVYQPESGFSTTILEMEGGGEQRYADRNTAKKVFRLSWKGNFTDIDALWAFYEGRRGAYEPFIFDNPVDGQSYVVRFAEDRLTYDQLTTKFFNQGLSITGFLYSDMVAGFKDAQFAGESIVQTLQLTEGTWTDNPASRGIERSIEVEGLVSDTVEIYVRNSATSAGYKALTFSKDEIVRLDRAVPFNQIKWTRPVVTDTVTVTMAYLAY